MNTHDIELPQGHTERPFDYWGELYTEGQVRAAIEADRKTYNSIGERTIQQLHDVLLYLQNEALKLEAAYGSNFKKEAAEKARAATEKMKEAVYAIKNIDRNRRGDTVYLYRRKGLDDFVTCDKSRYDELSDKPDHFETRVLYTEPQPAEPVNQLRKCRHCGWDCKPSTEDRGWYPLEQPAALAAMEKQK